MNIRITPGTVRPNPFPWEDAGWVDRITEHPDELESALRAAGIDDAKFMKSGLDQVMAGLISRHPEDYAPYGDHPPARPEARSNWKESIRSFFTGIKKKESEPVFCMTELPLCIFNSPRIETAKTTFTQTKITEATAGWEIEVLGSGAGSDITMTVTETDAFVSSNGDPKLVFVPLQLKVVEVSVYRYDEYQQKFLKAELHETEEHEANGLRSVSEQDWKRFVDGGKPVERFNLSGDKSGDIATYTKEYELAGQFEAKLGFKAFALESSVSAKFSTKEKASMQFELPPGRTYKLHRAQGIAGFYFGP